MKDSVLQRRNKFPTSLMKKFERNTIETIAFNSRLLLHCSFFVSFTYATDDGVLQFIDITMYFLRFIVAYKHEKNPFY